MIDRIEINLLPVEYRIHRKQFTIKREVAYPFIIGVVIAFGLSLFSIGFQNSVWVLRNEIKLTQNSIDKNRPIQNEIVTLRNDKNAIQEKIHALELINVNREKWVKLLEEFSGRLPDYTWLVSIREEVDPSPVIHIEGRTFSFPEVANYMSNLKSCSYILAVDLSQIEQIDPKDKLFRFAISCSINPDAYLSEVKDVASATPAANGASQ